MKKFAILDHIKSGSIHSPSLWILQTILEFIYWLRLTTHKIKGSTSQLLSNIMKMLLWQEMLHFMINVSVTFGCKKVLRISKLVKIGSVFLSISKLLFSKSLSICCSFPSVQIWLSINNQRKTLAKRSNLQKKVRKNILRLLTIFILA